MERREFLKLAAAGGVMAAARGLVAADGAWAHPLKRITIASASCGFEREPMVRPFGFKGGYLTEEWIVSSCLKSTAGRHGIGLGTQSCLWSDASLSAVK